MRLKKPPTKPTRRVLRKYISIDYCRTLQEFLDKVKEVNVPPCEIFRSYEQYASRPSWTYNEPEPDSTWLPRLNSYNIRLAKYNEWYEENKEEIEAELILRAERKHKAKEKKLKAERKRLLKEQKEIEKKLKDML